MLSAPAWRRIARTGRKEQRSQDGQEKCGKEILIDCPVSYGDDSSRASARA